MLFSGTDKKTPTCFGEGKLSVTRVYNEQEKLCGSPIETELINLGVFDYIVNNSDTNQLEIPPACEGRHAQWHMDLSLNFPLVANLILKGETHLVKEAMAKSTELGMQTVDQALFGLHEKGLISAQGALRNADSLNALRLRFKLRSKHSDAKHAALRIDHLSLHDENAQKAAGAVVFEPPTPSQ